MTRSIASSEPRYEAVCHHLREHDVALGVTFGTRPTNIGTGPPFTGAGPVQARNRPREGHCSLQFGIEMREFSGYFRFACCFEPLVREFGRQADPAITPAQPFPFLGRHNDR